MENNQTINLKEQLLYHSYVLHGIVNVINEFTNSNMRIHERVKNPKNNTFISGLMLISSLFVLGVDQACDNDIQQIAFCDERRTLYSRRRLSTTVNEKINHDIRNSFAHGDYGICTFKNEQNQDIPAIALNMSNKTYSPIVISLCDLKNYIISLIKVKKDNSFNSTIPQLSNGTNLDDCEILDRAELSQSLIYISDYYLNNNQFKNSTQEEIFKNTIKNPDSLQSLVTLAPLSIFTISTQDEYRKTGLYNTSSWLFEKDNFDIIRNSFAHGLFYKNGPFAYYFRDYHQNNSGEYSDRIISVNRNGIIRFLDDLTDSANNYIKNQNNTLS